MIKAQRIGGGKSQINHYNSIHIFDEVIPMSVRAAETPAEGVSIYKHDPKGKVAQAYEKLTLEVESYE